MDELKGTVLQVKFAPQAPGVFSGVDFEEPHGYVASPRGNGYDLIGSRRILFAFRSPTGIVVQFGAGGTTTPWLSLPKSASYQTGCIALSEIAALACPSTAAVKAKLSGAIALKSVHILFTVTTNDKHAPGGGVVLLDNIVYDPVPIRQQSAISLPLSTQTFGIAPLEQAGSGRVPFPPDQVNRNIASLYEASLGIIALLARAEGDDVHNALAIADALIYALGHDNQGDPLPVAADHATGLHNAYKSGDLDLLNSQGPGAGQAGQIQFAGFSIAPKGKCGAAGFCIVLDGATGGNNAFAVLALLKAHRKTGQPRYLNAALDIGNWIDEELLDPTGTGYGGYFLGYPDQGQKKVLQTSKSTENNADIFAAFTALAAAEQALGHPGQANKWTARAKIAGDFAISMLDRSRSCFFGGTVPHGTRAGPGIDPTGTRRGAEVINRSDFLDSNSFTYLALSSSAQYRSAADWSKVVKCLGQFRTSVKAAGATFSGYDLVRSP
ncbi:MAG TPA: hypothetical protein VFQ82_08410, partial [Stellaceae bacterium]|nr:hypothetical protein [Stellaceae bacterium]